MDKKLAATILLAIVSTSASIAILYWLGLRPVLGVNDFISDEVWYISSALNVAREVLHVSVKPTFTQGYYVFTVFGGPGCNASRLQDIVTGHGLSVYRVLPRADAVVVVVPVDEKARVFSLRGGCVKEILPGIYPDQCCIDQYLNTEHPPLIKYLYALAFHFLGFSFEWPRVLAFTLTSLALVALGYYGARYFYENGARPVHAYAPLMPLLLVALDSSVLHEGALGLLDGYVAALTLLAVVLALRDRHVSSALVLGLAAGAKYNGIFALPGIVAEAYLSTRSKARTLLVAVLPFIVVAVLWLPFIAEHGVKWVIDQVVGAMEWFTVSRPAGPPPTTPVGLLIGRPGMYLYKTPSLEIWVGCNPLITVTALVLATYGALGVALRGCLEPCPLLRRAVTASLAYLGVVSGFGLVYALGNHTLYNYYGPQVSMLAALVLVHAHTYITSVDYVNARVASECFSRPTALPWLGALGVSLGFLASAAVHGLFSVRPPIPSLDPAGWYAWLLSHNKFAELALVLAGYAFYSVLPFTLTRRGARGLAEASSYALLWVLVGFMAASASSGVFSALVAAAETSVFSSFVAGALVPVTAGALLRGRLLYAFLAGYASSLLLLAPLHSPLYWVAAVLGAAYAYLGRRLPGSVTGLVSSLLVPGALPVFTALGAGSPLSSPLGVTVGAGLVVLGVLRHSPWLFSTAALALLGPQVARDALRGTSDRGRATRAGSTDEAAAAGEAGNKDRH